MCLLEQEFTVHPVGQGLFYSGIVSIEEKKEPIDQFKFVFDCGSNTTAAGALAAKAFNNNQLGTGKVRLDMLTISHFDSDHVNKLNILLHGGVKIDKLVLPFSLFEERLFLVLRHLLLTRGNGISLYFIRLALDPIGTLSGNLDKDSTVYLITDDSTPPPNKNDPGPPNFTPDNTENRRFTFEFDNSVNPISSDVEQKFKGNLSRFPNLSIKEVKDSVKGGLYYFEHFTKLMEFIFYRKKITSDEKALYEDIYYKFCETFKIDKTLAPADLVENITTVIRSLRGGKRIKNGAYKKAISVLADLETTQEKAINLNTTALSMLHLNLDFNPLLDIKPEPDRIIEAFEEIKLLQKFDSFTTTEINLPYPGWSNWRHYYPHWTDHTLFPNCLLTSDSFLKEYSDVDAFYIRFAPYWKRFWLFQIPHHGSKNNSDRLLFSRVNRGSQKFINYGICHWALKHYKHPDAELLLELQATGWGNDLIAINEFLGLKFKLYWGC